MTETYECHFCSKKMDEDYFCHGCKKTVCEDCDLNFDMPFGAHNVEVHAQEPNF